MIAEQGTVWRFDALQRTGSVVLDDGRILVFDAEVFAASGLRLLRPGQRVRLETTADRVVSMTILTLDPPR